MPVAIALLSGWSLGWGMDLALRMGLARPASPELVALVRGRARAHGIELRGVHVLEHQLANALALPLARRIAFTRGCLEVLDDAELASITDHELGHLCEPRSVLFARLASTLALTPIVAIGPIYLTWGPAAVLCVAVVIILLLALGGRMRRRMEERADAHAHRENGRTHARALEALYRFNRAPAVVGRGPHPDLYDRMVEAGVEPAWPKPEPPSRWAPRLRVGAGLLVISIGVIAWQVVLAMLRVAWPDSALLQLFWGG